MNDFEDNETFIINKQIENEEEDEDQVYVPIQVGTQNLKIQYSLLWKYSKYVRDKYLICEARKHLSSELEIYQKEQRIKNESIYTFFEIIKEKQFKIMSDQYKDLLKLSEFFQCRQLQRILKQFYETHLSKCDFVLEQIIDELSIQNETKNPTFKVTNQMKTTLIEQINDCLQNEKFNQLSISLIFDILKNASKDDISNDLLFDFINKSINDNYVLFTFLCIEKLSEEKFLELEKIYQKSKENEDEYEKYFNYLPCNLTYILSLKSKIKKLSQQNNEQKEIIEKITNDLSERQQENEKLSSQFNQTKQENEKLSSQLNQTKQENEKLSSQLNQTKQENEKLSSHYNQTKQEKEKLFNQLNQIKRELEGLKNENFKFSDHLNKKEEEISNMKEESNKLKTDLNAKQNELLKIKDKVSKFHQIISLIDNKITEKNFIESLNEEKINLLYEKVKNLKSIYIIISEELPEIQNDHEKFREILKNLNKRKMKELEFNPRKGKNFDGIMRYLTNKTGGNIHDNGTIEITSNSINDNSHPKNLVNYQDRSRYQCLIGNSGDVYICFDFKDMLIQLSKYTIQSNDCPGQNCYNLRNWVIEVSEDGEKWKEIDHRSDDPSLNGRNIICTFNIQKPKDEFYRFVKLRQTGQTWSPLWDQYHFFFPYIEFYGRIKIPDNKF